MRHYMQTLRERGEILDVHREVDPKHELAAVTQAAMRRWNKPILFHRVAGTIRPICRHGRISISAPASWAAISSSSTS